MKTILVTLIALSVTGCASIVNDAMIPVTATFSDGSSGSCEFQNKRGLWHTKMPSTTTIRRSDDSLKYRCETKDGRKAFGFIESKIEGEKLGASILFLDLGITDAITDKHRYYQGNIVIPVEKNMDSE
uniref:Lipoprotein n=1 Tax=Candidatus Kentrum sp. TUN TaxID=2126343 RepID=A0A450ZD04_9GAMM|nr:MAG: hypothetical protein BECKTUN1418E_GA0071001_10039 [Candidatus Kentron sp. TUN]VFK51661.1 MAG: hypothetical protein BECKTUN1418F_GA0071002_10039 [Candidatus Kentron sp. TUN]